MWYQVLLHEEHVREAVEREGGAEQGPNNRINNY